MTTVDHPDAVEVMRRCMVPRIATVSRTGRPRVNPLYAVYVDGRIWLGTAEWTLAARNVRADPRVSLLFDAPGGTSALSRVWRITGRAAVRTDRGVQRSYNLRVVRKYVMTPGGIGNLLAHLRQLPLRRRYYAQSAARGRPCVIEVIPERAELI